MKTYNKINMRGDTIVEVLIAIAVVSLVLAGSYASTRRSANATRTAQEQGEALKFAESQVEQIKAALESSPAGTIPPDSTQGSIPYTVKTTITPLGSNNYNVIVTWPGLSGITNSVELDYKAQ